jgi:flagellin
MGLQINTNVAAMNAYRNLSSTQNAMSTSLERLSSGLRINRAADDAAGLVISQGLRAHVSGLKVATRNAQDGISVVQTAEGALSEVHAMLNRMRDLAVQSINGSNDSAARTAANNEITQLKAEITRVAGNTKFGTLSLLAGGDFESGVAFQIGANAGDTISVTISAIASSVNTTGDVTTASNASSYIASVDEAIANVSTIRGKLGALQNRFESTINNIQVATENLAASEGRIRDTDMALEMVSFTRHQILTQAGTAMLGQANSVPQNVLGLLG